MSIVIVTDENGQRVIDLTRIEALVATMQDNWRKGVFTYPDGWFEILKESDADQLQHLSSQLMGLAAESARLYAHSFTKSHVKLVQDLHELRDAAKAQGEMLWPEMGD